MFRHRDRRVDEVGEVLGDSDQLSIVLVDQPDLLPAMQILVVIERPHVLRAVSRREQLLLVRQRHVNRLLEHHAVRPEAEGLRLAG